MNWFVKIAQRTQKTIWDIKRINNHVDFYYGGKCLDNVYKSLDTPMNFECVKGHKFKKRFIAILLRNSFCSQCNTRNINQEKTRFIIETLTGQEFDPQRLTSNTGKYLFLDGYSEQLKCAFEHHGIQHYKENKHWHKNRTFQQQQQRDIDLASLCKQMGIKLLEIPYTESKNNETIVKYISSLLQKNKVPYKNNRIDFGEFYKNYDHNIKMLKKVQNYVKVNHPGAKVISDIYIKHDIKMDFVCKKGHPYSASWGSISQNHWCPDCSGHAKISVEKVQEFLNKWHRGAVIHNKGSINSVMPLNITCEKGHNITSSWHNISQKNKKGEYIPKGWCKPCLGILNITIERVQEFLNKWHRGAVIHNKGIITTKMPLNITCEKGHNITPFWHRIAIKDKNGQDIPESWCETCYRQNSRLTIDKIHQKLQNYHPGSVCLEKEYIDKITPMWFKCEKGHMFQKTWTQVLMNNSVWCKQCKIDEWNKNYQKQQSGNNKRTAINLSGWLNKIAQTDSDNYNYEKAEHYFSIGHGDFDENTGTQSGYQAWVYHDRRIRVSEIIKIDQETGETIGGTSHGIEWGHEMCDKTYKGRYEVDTGRISVVKPCHRKDFQIPQFLKDLLYQKFPDITEIIEF